MVGRRLASALSWRCFPAGHHQLQHPLPTANPAVPSSPSNAYVVHASPPWSSNVCTSIRPRKNISVGPSGRSRCRYRTKTIFSKALCTWLSRQLLIMRIELSALLAPYRAMLGTATRFPVPTTGRRGDADGPASAPPPGPPPLRRRRAPSSFRWFP
jgi:hypothetical protein